MNPRKLAQKQKKFDYLNDVNLCCYGRVFGYSNPTASKAINKVCLKKQKAVS